VYGDQKEARDIEKGHTPGQSNMHHMNSPLKKRKTRMPKPKESKRKLRLVQTMKQKKFI
jgi:hypothetical protein